MNNELKHYGVLGMKWGVRRYQPYTSGGPTGEFKPSRKQQKAAKKYEKKMYKVTDKMARSRVQINTAASVLTKHVLGVHDEVDAAEKAKEIEQFFPLAMSVVRYQQLKNMKDFRKAEEISKKYGLVSFNEMAKANDDFIKKIEKELKNPDLKSPNAIPYSDLSSAEKKRIDSGEVTYFDRRGYPVKPG